MFCNQCEQTTMQGCTIQGTCGNPVLTARMQDVVVQTLRELACIAHKARQRDIVDTSTDNFMVKALSSTMTSVNFNDAELESMAYEALCRCKALATLLGDESGIGSMAVAAKLQELRAMRPNPSSWSDDPAIRSAMQWLLYGLKGLAAYVNYAASMGQRNAKLYNFLYEALAAGVPQSGDPVPTLEQWVDLMQRCGECTLLVLAMLDEAHTTMYGDPVPTHVALGQRKGKAILVSGHNLKALHDVLLQTDHTGINVYTHGELLPAHGYPTLRHFSHLAGHYGTSSQNQNDELADFPGAVLFTTACLQSPAGYERKAFATGQVGYPGLTRCANDDYTALIATARNMEGFTYSTPGRMVTVGFGRKAAVDSNGVLAKGIQAGTLQHIFVLIGCDNSRASTDYCAQFVEQAPQDSVIVTLACGKFSFFCANLGTVAGVPRLIDMGQANDLHSVMQGAQRLAATLHCGVHELPVDFVLSWSEQKAVAILLAMLAQGIRHVRLSPSLPDFISPELRKLMEERWDMSSVTTATDDINFFLQHKLDRIRTN